MRCPTSWRISCWSARSAGRKLFCLGLWPALRALQQQIREDLGHAPLPTSTMLHCSPGQLERAVALRQATRRKRRDTSNYGARCAATLCCYDWWPLLGVRARHLPEDPCKCVDETNPLSRWVPRRGHTGRNTLPAAFQIWVLPLWSLMHACSRCPLASARMRS